MEQHVRTCQSDSRKRLFGEERYDVGECRRLDPGRCEETGWEKSFAEGLLVSDTPSG